MDRDQISESAFFFQKVQSDHGRQTSFQPAQRISPEVYISSNLHPKGVHSLVHPKRRRRRKLRRRHESRTGEYISNSVSSIVHLDDNASSNFITVLERCFLKMFLDDTNSGCQRWLAQVTDFVSFYSLPSTVVHHPTHSTIQAAYSFYAVANSVSLCELMNDALIVAKNVRIS